MEWLGWRDVLGSSVTLAATALLRLIAAGVLSGHKSENINHRSRDNKGKENT